MIQIEPSHIDSHAATPEKKPEPCIMVIFGASGDLTRRKLIPALYQLAAENQLPECFKIVGFARSKKDAEEFRSGLESSAEEYARIKPFNTQIWKKFSEKIEYHQGDYKDPESFKALRDKLQSMDQCCSTGGNRLFYLATPPSLAKIIVDNLYENCLIYAPHSDPWARVIIEKPFGHDLESARELNAFVGKRLHETQTYRIDHYLGKETVQNILVFRFGNAIFEPIWNRNNIDHVQITAAEAIGVKGRGSFYDEAGVLRDFVQNHLLEVMTLCAMEQPISFQADPIRDEKVKVLRSLQPISAYEVSESVVVGQYEGYQDVEGVKAGSRTPTYAAMKVMIDNWRWQGVPFYLRAGKSLGSRVTEISVHFRQIPLCLFGQEEVCKRLAPNVLKLRIQPDEGISLQFVCKTPGDNVDVSNVFMDFGYEDAFGLAAPDAYERLLVDAMRGDATLFARSDGVEFAWAFISPILKALENDKESRIPVYKAGGSGPEEAGILLQKDGRSWDAIT